MLSKFLLSCLALAFWAQTAGSAYAQTEDPFYLTQYRLYNEAYLANDHDAARRYGLAAWRAGETTLGDHSTTAILAYNYGKLAIYTDPKVADEALTRAANLQAAGMASLPADDLALYHVYANFAAEGGRRRSDALRQTLRTVETRGGEWSNEHATFWLHLAKQDLEDKRHREATRSAATAEAAIMASAPDNYVARSKAILIGGMGKLHAKDRTLADAHAARDDFTRAAKLFPLQTDVESFDPVLAEALAWSAAAEAVILTLDNNRKIAGARPGGRGSAQPVYFEDALIKPDDCGVRWASRKPPTYPTSAYNKGSVGAVVAVYDLSDETNVQNPRILSAVPDETFGKAVLKSLKTWKLKTTPVDHPGCRKNIMKQFTFFINQ